MTTGRINQVAFLGDATARTIPDVEETRGARRECVSFSRSMDSPKARQAGRGPSRRHRVPHPKAPSDRPWAGSAEIRSTETQASRLDPPRTPEEARSVEGQHHIRIPPQWVGNTGTPPRSKHPRALGPKLIRQPADSSVHQHRACQHVQHDDHSSAAAYTQQRSRRANHGPLRAKVETRERDRAGTA